MLEWFPCQKKNLIFAILVGGCEGWEGRAGGTAHPDTALLPRRPGWRRSTSTPRRTWSSCCWAIRWVQGPPSPRGVPCRAVPCRAVPALPLLSPWLSGGMGLGGHLPANWVHPARTHAGLCCFLGSDRPRGDHRGLGGSGGNGVPGSQWGV